MNFFINEMLISSWHASFLSFGTTIEFFVRHEIITRNSYLRNLIARANSHIFICLLTFLSELKAIHILQCSALISMQSISHVWLAIFIKSCMGSCWYLKLFVWKFSLIEEWRLQLNVISHIDTFLCVLIDNHLIFLCLPEGQKFYVRSFK